MTWNDPTIPVYDRKLIKSQKYNPIAFLDYDESKVGTFIQGIQIKSYEELKKDDLEIENAIISSSNMSRELLDKTYSYLKELHIKNIKLVPKLQNRVDFDKLKDLSIEDLLARKPKDLDKKVIHYKTKHDLVSGTKNYKFGVVKEIDSKENKHIKKLPEHLKDAFKTVTSWIQLFTALCPWVTAALT